MLELIRSKCILILIYELECFALTKSDVKSLDFAVNKFLMCKCLLVKFFCYFSLLFIIYHVIGE